MRGGAAGRRGALGARGRACAAEAGVQLRPRVPPVVRAPGRAAAGGRVRPRVPAVPGPGVRREPRAPPRPLRLRSAPRGTRPRAARRVPAALCLGSVPAPPPRNRRGRPSRPEVAGAPGPREAPSCAHPFQRSCPAPGRSSAPDFPGKEWRPALPGVVPASSHSAGELGAGGETRGPAGPGPRGRPGCHCQRPAHENRAGQRRAAQVAGGPEGAVRRPSTCCVRVGVPAPLGVKENQ